jgi:hypothetical protein
MINGIGHVLSFRPDRQKVRGAGPVGDKVMLIHPRLCLGIPLAFGLGARPRFQSGPEMTRPASQHYPCATKRALVAVWLRTKAFAGCQKIRFIAPLRTIDIPPL